MGSDQSFHSDILEMGDLPLARSISSTTKTLQKMGSKLADNGARLRRTLELFLEEQQRRQLMRGSNENIQPDIRDMADQKLAESIASKTKTLQKMGSKLADNGARLRRTLELLLKEQERRKLLDGSNEVLPQVSLSLFRSKLLPDSDDHPAEQIIRSYEDYSSEGCSAPMDLEQSILSDIREMADQKLAESIASKTKTLQKLGSKLADNGARLRRTLQLFLEEQVRRQLLHGSNENIHLDIREMADKKLAESIASKTKTLQNLGFKLADNGARLRHTVELLLKEQERRKLLHGSNEVSSFPSSGSSQKRPTPEMRRV